MMIRPQAASGLEPVPGSFLTKEQQEKLGKGPISLDEASGTLFGREEGVPADPLWSVDRSDLSGFTQCTSNGALVLYSRDKIVRMDMKSGLKQFEVDTEAEPGSVYPAKDHTVVAYRDGRVVGLGATGQVDWSFQIPNPCHNMTYGLPHMTVMSLFTLETNKHYHMAVNTDTGEVLWRQPGAVYDPPIPVGKGVQLMKSGLTPGPPPQYGLISMDQETGSVLDRLPVEGYTRSLVGDGQGNAWYLDLQNICQVQVQDGKMAPGWKLPVEAELYQLRLPEDNSVLLASMKGEIQGLDPATGKKLWSQPTEGALSQWDRNFIDQDRFLVASRDRLTCLSTSGERMWEVAHGGDLRVSPRGIVRLEADPSNGKFRLERLDPLSGGVMYWAEIPRGNYGTPWLDPSGRVKVTTSGVIELFQLPDPENLPPPRTQVVAERGDSVVIGGVRVKKR